MSAGLVWPTVALEEIGAPEPYAIAGGPFGSDLTRADYVERPGVPVIRGTNLGGDTGQFVDDGFVYVTDQKAVALEKNLARPGDLVFTQRGTLGQVAIIPTAARHPRYVVSQSQMKISVDTTRADAAFVWHYFRSPDAQRQLLRQTLATGVPHINLGILRRLTLPLPPLPEQRRIAALLDKADAIRRKRQQALRLADDLLRSAFLDVFGDPREDGRRWPTVTIRDIVTNAQYGTSVKANAEGRGVPVVRMNNLSYEGLLDLTDVKRCELGPVEDSKLRLKEGDILFNRTNSPELVGKTAVWDAPGHFVFAGYLIRVRLRPEVATPRYLWGLLNSAWGKRRLLVKAKASNNMSNISATELLATPIPLPPIELQARFEQAFRRMSQVREVLRRAEMRSADLVGALAQRSFGPHAGE